MNMSNTTRVLVAEDHEQTLGVLRSLLTRSGYIVSTVTSAHEAIEVLTHETFDVLICEVHLHDGSGTDVASVFNRTSCGCAIAVSENSAPGNEQRLTDAGFAHHIVRPRGVMQLLPLLDNVCRS